ncbi:50S ribosomal protein L24, chloroplastic [Elsinoe australis]|uniref:50S ribosomal protein L24, chloroplastic n=1 Tax=Elsinoe australis TaxID=40998 RepID=A0A2P7YL98_9PEZI|nr:50S ribosomal protein L24, chloroplastic [Elsinoe australis]
MFWKTLRDNTGSPATIRQRHYWLNMFTSFAKSTLDISKRKSQTPIGADIGRFFSAVISYLKGRNPNTDAISWVYFKSGKYQLHKALTIKYPDYKLSRHEAQHLDMALKRLLDEGKLTREPTREKQWIGAVMVKKLVLTLVQNALVNGVLSWDVLLSKWLGLVLQSALNCRPGDFRQSYGWNGTQHLLWRHVDIRAFGDNTDDPKLAMKITLAYTKGKKDKPESNFALQVHQLDNEASVIDPIKLIIGLALRVEAVPERDWKTLVTNVLSRPNKSLVWSKPDFPVFCSFMDSGRGLILGSAAGTNQQIAALNEAGRLVGVLDRIWSTDIRRGAAGEIANLAEPITGSSMTLVAAGLGHSNKARFQGITEAYAGDLRADLYGKKTERVKAGKTLHDERRKAWVNDQTTKLNTPQQHHKSKENHINANGKRGSEVVSATVGAKRRKPSTGRTALEVLHPNTTAPLASGSPIPDDLIDPTLRAVSDHLGYTQDSNPLNEPLVASEEPVGPADDYEVPAGIPTDRLETFMNFISKINVILAQSDRTGLPGYAASGGSRDDPTIKLFVCQYSNCDYTHRWRQRVDKHEDFCPHRPDGFLGKLFALDSLADAVEAKYNEDDPTVQPTVPATVQPAAPAPVQPTVQSTVQPVVQPTVPATVQPEAKAKPARKKYTPKQCPKKDECDIDKVFPNQNQYNQHNKLHHSANPWTSIVCQIPECSSKVVWVDRHDYYHHVRNVHRMSPDDVTALLNQNNTVDFQATGTSKVCARSVCLYPNCKHTGHVFNDWPAYRGHLRRVHQLEGEDRVPYIPTQATARLPS